MLAAPDMITYAGDPAFEKLLSDNRDRYIEQSSNTRCGQVAQLPKRNEPNAWLMRLELCALFSQLPS